MLELSLSLIIFVLVSIVTCDQVRDQVCGYDYPSYYPPVTLSDAVLIQSQVVIRHGDRTPWQGNLCWPSASNTFSCSLADTSIPDNDPSKFSASPSRLYRKRIMPGRNSYPGDCLTGQLTSRGYNQHLSNGRKFYSAYTKASLISPSYTETEIYLRSDNEERTVQSAQALFMGMYNLSSISQTQIIDIHTMDRNNDDMTINSWLCPVTTDLQDAAHNSPEYLYHIKTVMEPLWEEMTNLYGEPVTQDNFNDLLDCSVVYYCNNFTLPDGVDGSFILSMNQAQAWQWSYTYAYPNVELGSQTGIGFLIQDIYDAMKRSVAQLSSKADRQSTNYTNLVLYSGHDTTILPLLVAYRVDDGYLPHYASTLFWELFRLKDNSLRVRMVYNEKELSIPGCDSVYCDYNTFLKITETLLPNLDLCEQ